MRADAMMNRLWLSVLANVLLAATAFSQEVPTAAIEQWLGADGALWKLSADQFLTQHGRDGFRRVAVGEPVARSTAAGLTFLELKVWEAIVRFESNTVREVTLSLYNRGDAGDWSVREFETFMSGLNTRLNGWAGAKGVTLRDQPRTTAVTLMRKAWVKPPHQADMLWSFTAKSKVQGTEAARPEFARVQLTRFDPARDPRKLQFATASMPGKPLTAQDLKTRVQRAPNGDVVIVGVPMVDQGQKGYCAAAVAERLLRYYGRPLDQHEIAQLANTSTDAGTNPEAMIAALRRICGDLKLDVNVYLDFDYKDFEKVVGDYNRAAKRADLPEVSYKTQIGNTIFVEAPAVVYQQLDPELLKQIRVKRAAAMEKFQTDIQQFINHGVPLAWSVMLGKLPEQPEVRGAGGHMRLIIGGNPRTKEILYTDTWGPGHEQKRMSLADAWTITLGLYSLTPSDVRF